MTKKLFLKDAFVVFTMASGKKCALMGTLELMVEDKVGKALRLATEEERHEMEGLMEADMRHWQSVKLQEM
jgi:hypothetical protein